MSGSGEEKRVRHRAADRRWRQNRGKRPRPELQAYREINRETLNRKAREYRARGGSALQRFKKYGITQSQYEALLATQQNLCAICELPLGRIKEIDHCHATGKVRGIVHGNCNRLLGLGRESAALFQKVVGYLARHAAIERPVPAPLECSDWPQRKPQQELPLTVQRN